MAGVNKAIIVGHLGNDPDVRALDGGSKVATFSVATTETYKDKNTGEKVSTTEWHRVILWNSLAEIAEKYIKKGSQIYIEGKLQTKSYQDKDGVTKYSTAILGQNLTMLGSADSSNSNSEKSQQRQTNRSAAETRNESGQGSQFPRQSQEDEDEDEDDLPF